MNIEFDQGFRDGRSDFRLCENGEAVSRQAAIRCVGDKRAHCHRLNNQYGLGYLEATKERA